MSVKVPRPPRGEEPEDWADWCEQVERQLTLVGSRTLDIGSIGAGLVVTFTIPVIGCKVDQQQAVSIAAPSSINASLLWCGLVSADDVVTIRISNPTGGAIDPAEARWGARVFL